MKHRIVSRRWYLRKGQMGQSTGVSVWDGVTDRAGGSPEQRRTFRGWLGLVKTVQNF